MGRPAFGTWDWVEATGGRLATRDKLRIVAEGVRARAARRLTRRFDGYAVTPARYVDVDDILPPDSALTRAAEKLCAQVSEPYLYNHCLRAYFWARLLNGDRAFDDEATYVALLLHDLGLTDAFRLSGQTVQCFTLPAARIAHGMAVEHGWDDKRARLVADAIALHLNVVIGDEHGREAQLVRMGSGADVVGHGLMKVSCRDQEKVLARYPRYGMKANIHAALMIEAGERPCCRIAFMTRRLGFTGLIAAAPFAE